MKKHIIEKDNEQKKEQSKLHPQQQKNESVWKIIRKFVLSWARVDPKL